MSQSSDVVEVYSERALIAGIGGLIAFAGAALTFNYGRGYLTGLAIILALAGVAGVVYAIMCYSKIRKVESFDITCVYCKKVNKLTEPPTKDFTCRECHRLVPIMNGKVLPVQQVRCGFCNELNYYSEKTEVLLCEACNHDIPISRGDDSPARRSAFAVQDDDRPYELKLVGKGHKEEELIGTLQHMLALNRNQVKDMLNDLPVVLLTGIPKKKAEMLAAQLHVHGAAAEYNPLP